MSNSGIRRILAKERQSLAPISTLMKLADLTFSAPEPQKEDSVVIEYLWSHLQRSVVIVNPGNTLLCLFPQISKSPGLSPRARQYFM